MSESNAEQIKVFSFRSVNDLEEEETTVSVIEKLQANYSSTTWPAAPILALYLWEHRKELPGKHILELGAGTALPGILSAKCGAYVTLSESVLLPKSIQHLIRSCELNDLHSNQVEVIGLTWGLFTNSIFKLKPVDLIIGSDCFYEPVAFEDIIATVSFLLEKNPLAKFLTAYQERSADWSIEHLLHKWNLCCKSINIENLGVDSGISVDELLRGHTIHLFEISRKF